MNKPNVKLFCEDYHVMLHKILIIYLALRVSEIAGDRCTIVYTNFIDNIGLIIGELSDVGHS